MFEFIGMIILILLLWFLLVGPTIFGTAFDLNNFKDAIIVNAIITGFLLGLAVFTFAIAMCINFLSGDPEPITTFMQRFK